MTPRKPTPTHCLWCNAPLAQPATGRPRYYCVLPAKCCYHAKCARMTPEQRDADRVRHARAYAEKQAARKKITRTCPECGSPMARNAHTCDACKVKAQSERDAARRELFRTKAATKPAVTPAHINTRKTSQNVACAIPARVQVTTAGSGVKHLQPNRDKRASEAERMDAIVWAAQQPGYNPRKCGEWVKEYFEMLEKHAEAVRLKRPDLDPMVKPLPSVEMRKDAA